MVDFHHMGVTLASVKPQLIIVGLSIMLLNYCLKTYRWALILWVRRPDISFGRLARFNFVSIFLGSFLLSSVSADIARVYYVSQHTADPRAAISSIFADRIIGTFSLAIVTRSLRFWFCWKPSYSRLDRYYPMGLPHFCF